MPAVVVPGYYLVCYNIAKNVRNDAGVVVPGYYLVCYNGSSDKNDVNLL